jgi:hypothetical protein
MTLLVNIQLGHKTRYSAPEFPKPEPKLLELPEPDKPAYQIGCLF